MKNKTYSYDEAFDASLKYFDGDELAARVWVNKYAMKDSFGNIYEQSPEDMHNRLANEIARIEQKYPNPMSTSEIFQLLDHFSIFRRQGHTPQSNTDNFQPSQFSPFHGQSFIHCLFQIGVMGYDLIWPQF